MSDNPRDIIDKALKAPPVFLEVYIKYNAITGQVTSITGPMDHPALFFGILELAREAVYLDRLQKLPRKTSHLAGGPGLLSGV